MTWETYTGWEILFDFAVGYDDINKLSWKVGEDKKEATKEFKRVVDQWKRKKPIITESFALQAEQIEAIFLLKGEDIKKIK